MSRLPNAALRGMSTMPRPMWKGAISFGLVMIPVTLHSGESSKTEIDLDMLDSRDQSRIRFRRVNETTGKEVEWASIVKGFEYEDGKYVLLTPADFKAAGKGVAKGGIEITDFVDRESISPRYFEKPYFLEPGKGGEKVYALLRDALQKTDRVGIAKIVLQTRQHMALLTTEGDALMLVTIRFPEELRDPSDLALPAKGAAKASAAEMAMATQLIDGMTGEWDPSKYKDEYTASLRALIKSRTGGPGGGKTAPTVEDDEDIPETYDIMAMLRKSVEAQGKPARRTASGTAASATSKKASTARPGRAGAAKAKSTGHLKRKAG